MSRREITREIASEDEIPFALRWADAMARKGLAGGKVIMRLGRERRSLDQNAKLWPMLTDVAKKVEWVKDGERCFMNADEWKDLFTASLKKQSMAPGIEGGMVVLGMRTSRMNKALFSQLIELIYAFGAERGVEWSDTSQQTIGQYREAS